MQLVPRFPLLQRKAGDSTLSRNFLFNLRNFVYLIKETLAQGEFTLLEHCKFLTVAIKITTPKGVVIFMAE